MLSSSSNSLCSLLYACLVTGFGSSNATSLTRVGGVATLAFSSAHSFKVGDPVQVDGATPAAYNGKWTVASVTGNTVSYVVPGAPATPATGTVTCKIAPAGWTRPFSSGNVSVFRSSDVTGSQRYLRVNDAGAADTSNVNKADCSLYESMTSVSAGVLSGTKPWLKVYAGETSTKWMLVASGKAFYVFSSRYPTGGIAGGAEPEGSALNLFSFFGDIASFKSGDSFNCVLTSTSDALLTTEAAGASSSIVCRAYTLTGAAIEVGGRGFELIANLTVATGLNAADNSVVFVAPRLVVESVNTSNEVIRGQLPGYVASLTAYAGAVLGNVNTAATASGRWERFDNVLVNGSSRSVMLFYLGTYGKGFALDITGPW